MECANQHIDMLEQIIDANDLYEWAMSKKLPVNGFKWENDISKFNENTINNYNENSDVGYFLEVRKKEQN